jgi:CRISPR/Cas system-associated protein endoribonuclease Cas2
MDIEITPTEIIAEMQRRYPKETEICFLTVTNKQMAQILDEATPEDEEVNLEVVEDASI